MAVDKLGTLDLTFDEILPLFQLRTGAGQGFPAGVLVLSCAGGRIGELNASFQQSEHLPLTVLDAGTVFIENLVGGCDRPVELIEAVTDQVAHWVTSFLKESM